MDRVCAPFEGKNVTLLGLGLLGRGVGDAIFLAKCGARVVVTDLKGEDELAPSVAQLRTLPNITLHLGGHRVDDFTGADLVIKAAGVPLDSKEITAAQDAGVQVAMSTALFAEHAMDAGATIVGVTGTRGKSTVTQMIYEVLKAAPRPSSGQARKVLLGGNVRGVSTLAMLPEVTPETICVLELDSWQLQGFGDLQISPHVAVFTNLMPDHLNYYPDMEAYFADKANIFRFQKKGDALIIGSGIVSRILEAKPPIEGVVPVAIPDDWKLKIPGQHNRENASFAVAALSALGLSEEEIKNGIESFEGVEGRLQLVREANGKKIYNDNSATTPEATIAALDALGKDITLIIGGAEKNLSLEQLVSKIKSNVSSVILLTHQNYKGSVRLASELQKANIAFAEADNLQHAINLAMQTISETILFSPAFASFGMFKNEYDRGDQFNAIVKGL